MQVIKRDGSLQEFNEDKILNAISEAMKSVNAFNLLKANEITERVIAKILKNNNNIGVEDIQDLVEKELMRSCKDAAKSFIIYRKEHEKIRESKTNLYKNLNQILHLDILMVMHQWG